MRKGNVTKALVPHVRKKPRMSTHHRTPRAQGGSQGPTVQVTQTQHRAWHTLFDGTLLPEDICAIINALWLDDRYYFVCRRRK